MRLLLDTHIFLALIGRGAGSLPAAVVARLTDGGNQHHLSAASLWEIAIKSRLGKLKLTRELDALPELLGGLGIKVVAIDQRHALASVEPEPTTSDPFDLDAARAMSGRGTETGHRRPRACVASAGGEGRDGDADRIGWPLGPRLIFDRLATLAGRAGHGRTVQTSRPCKYACIPTIACTRRMLLPPGNPKRTLVMTTLNANDGYVVLINTFTVDPNRAEELLKILSDATKDVMRKRPGFVSANLHMSNDRKHVANYAQWQNQTAIEE